MAHPDSLRFAGRGDLNKAFPFNAESRGRRSVALDLTTERGRELALELFMAADVVAENLRGGSLDKLGLGWDDMSGSRRPDLVYVVLAGLRAGRADGEDAGLRAAQCQLRRGALALEPRRCAISVRHNPESSRPHRREASGGRGAGRP